jgi:hypothetical protein
MRMMAAVLAAGTLWLVATGLAVAADRNLDIGRSAELWAFGRYDRLVPDSLLNPYNAALLPAKTAQVEARMHFDWSREFKSFGVKAVVEPRFIALREWTAMTTERSVYDNQRANLTQGFLRIEFPRDTITGGREVLIWGPGTFRSPSNPFYFDPQKTDPLADKNGIDLVRITHDAGVFRYTVGYVFSNAPVHPPPVDGVQHGTALLKLDRVGDDSLMSLVASVDVATGDRPFLGGFVQRTMGDAWLVYAEASVSRPALFLDPNTIGSPVPFVVRRPGSLGATGLIGASYTLENGQFVTLEYLHSSLGYAHKMEQRFFDQLRAVKAGLPVPAGVNPWRDVPQPFGADYLWCGWQSNPQNFNLSWRLDVAVNLGDDSAGLQGYIEKSFTPMLSGFVLVGFGLGNVDTEYGGIYRSRAVAGVKVFMW